MNGQINLAVIRGVCNKKINEHQEYFVKFS